MRFRLVEDTTITVDDTDFENIVKPFLSDKKIKYNLRDKSYVRDYFGTQDNNQDISDLVDDKVKKSFIAEFNKSLANTNNPTVLNSIYNTIGNFNANSVFANLIKNYGDIFVDKPIALNTIARLIDSSRLSNSNISSILNDKKFFAESDDDVAYKLKVVALINNPDAQEKWTGKNADDVRKLDWTVIKPDNSYMSRAEMDAQLQKIEANSVGNIAEIIKARKNITKDLLDRAYALYSNKNKQLYKPVGRIDTAYFKALDSGKDSDVAWQEVKKSLDDSAKIKQTKHDLKKADKQAEREKERKLTATEGPTGKAILAKKIATENKTASKADKKKLDRQTIYDYVKSLINQNNMGVVAKSISKMVDNGDFDDELDDLLTSRYISAIGAEPIEKFDRAVVKTLNKAFDKITKQDEKEKADK